MIDLLIRIIVCLLFYVDYLTNHDKEILYLLVFCCGVTFAKFVEWFKFIIIKFHNEVR